MTRSARRWILAPLLAGLFVARDLPSQGIVQPHPDCNLLERRTETMPGGRVVLQRRLAWHLEYAAGAYLLASAIGVVAPRLPRWLVATGTAVSLGLAPHVRSVLVRHDYPLNPLDVAFDAVNRATPFIWSAADRRRAFVVWVIPDLALSCWASP